MVSKCEIKDVFIGNVTLKNQIVEINNTKINFINDITKIFNKICSSGNFQIGQRSKLLASNDSCFYFTLMSSNIFYLIVTDKNYSEPDAFRVVDLIHDKLFSLLNEDKEITKDGINQIKQILTDFENEDTTSKIVASTREDLKDISVSMKNNLKEILRTTDDARDLEVKSNNIKLGALEFENNSNELKKATCWQNFKWTIILSSLAVVLVLVIVIPFIK